MLLHIGPKTGTTALQNSLAAARIGWPVATSSIRARRCRIGTRPAPYWDATRRHQADPPVPIRELGQRLVRRVARRPGRAIVSSEGFADAEPEQIDRIVADLGRSAVHVLITVRGLGAILPSTWQQDLKSGAPVPLPGVMARMKSRVVKPFDEWVAETLGDTRGKSLFWWRNDFSALAQRWAEAVGPDNVTVAVVSSDDPDRILRDAESLVGLPDRFLRREGKAAEPPGVGAGPTMAGAAGVRPVRPRRYHDWCAGRTNGTSSKPAGPDRGGSVGDHHRRRTAVAGAHRPDRRRSDGLPGGAIWPIWRWCRPGPRHRPIPAGRRTTWPSNSSWGPAVDRQVPVDESESGGELRATLADRLRRRRR